jgi:hypothetical protein
MPCFTDRSHILGVAGCSVVVVAYLLVLKQGGSMRWFQLTYLAVVSVLISSVLSLVNPDVFGAYASSATFVGLNGMNFLLAWASNRQATSYIVVTCSLTIILPYLAHYGPILQDWLFPWLPPFSGSICLVVLALCLYGFMHWINLIRVTLSLAALLLASLLAVLFARVLYVDLVQQTDICCFGGQDESCPLEPGPYYGGVILFVVLIWIGLLRAWCSCRNPSAQHQAVPTSEAVLSPTHSTELLSPNTRASRSSFAK